jgi:tol-pal system protein YbgF
MTHRNFYVSPLFLICFLFPAILPGTSHSQARDNLAPLDARITQMENELQRLTGQIEEQSFKIRSLEQELQKKMSDAELRLNDLEQRPAGTTNTSSPTDSYNTPYSDTPAPSQGQSSYNNSSNVLGQINSSSQAANSTPTAIYEDAFATLRSGDYAQAETKFQAFLNSNPDSNLSDNARYWLAETYYVRNQYDQAARGFAQAYQANPKGSKAPDNLLKLSLSLSGLGKKKDACVALDQLLQNYKTGPKAILGRAEQEQNRLACN